MAHTYEYPRPALAVDCVVFGLDDEDLKVLLIQRDLEPQAGEWALPGGFVHMDENVEEAARRELEEETSLRDLYLEQLYTFSEPGRDPRERVVSVAHYALVNLEDHQPRAATDARATAWFPAAHPPPLAFDHSEILAMARERLRGKVRYAPVGFELLPKKFTLRELQRLYEQILEEPLDKRNFRKKVLETGLLVDLDELQENVAHRRARYYRFDEDKYRELLAQGLSFRV